MRKNTFNLKVAFIIFFLCAGFVQSNAQEIVDSLLTRQINSIQKVASWLIAYDRVAWASSDMIPSASSEELSRMGREWFCYSDSNRAWHAVYGKYTDDGFQIALHYVTSIKTGRLEKTTESPDLLISFNYAHAINSAYKQLAADSANQRIQYNHYVRQDDEGKFLVWIFPGSQRDGAICYGKEYHYRFDSDCSTLLTKNIVNKQLMGAAPNPKIPLIMDYSDMEAPTLGAVFFASNYSKLFNNVYIKTKFHLHSLSEGVWKSVRTAE